MAFLATERGLLPDDLEAGRLISFEALWSGQDLPEDGFALDFPNDRDPADLAPWLGRITLIRVAFPAMGDGRGFSIAQRLRDLGYGGRLRAAGPLIADQAEAARRVGFDEIEVVEDVAARQPAELWTRPRRVSYQERLFG